MKRTLTYAALILIGIPLALVTVGKLMSIADERDRDAAIRDLVGEIDIRGK